ncbi:hypothetical protein NDU88_002421 [Pleurodeles waltl]|uniref:Uncharacterized protein n=1 Tax=Pleurodeles waltl TaxID=8319 RepID=A0AAV7KTH4_PLEWA|nr:hypothetical protein NDU88_002421 [Pleurodeles waltl]
MGGRGRARVLGNCLLTDPSCNRISAQLLPICPQLQARTGRPRLVMRIKYTAPLYLGDDSRRAYHCHVTIE